ncbi:WASH1, WAHD domain [Cinara cedri]|uniref:WASH1, WAHD domain n=1 Tax=Cinara cedri TaxID=506608 RepID=A0A5E4MMK7_9HEMI|nr:WASH1, WAHD domain [Cinara cedri]
MVKVNKEAYIPLLPYDLGYEETVLQLIKSLDCLNKVVECVYEHVRDNINLQKLEVVKLCDRLNSVTNKVHRLSNIKKSIQVYSSSKYPAAHCQKDYEYYYDFDVKSDIIENIPVTHKISVFKDPSAKLKFYRVNNENIKLLKNKDIYSTRGLGDLPDNVKYVNSLLLFNSNVNLYKNYVLSNPYKVNNTIAPSDTEKDQHVENIHKPVFTLPLNEVDSQFNYSYTPVDEEVPSIDVPADLPDLPGIAGDVQYFEEEKIIAEPVVISKPSNVVVGLPSFDELDDLKDDQMIADDSAIITVEKEITKLGHEQLLTAIAPSTQNKIDDNIEDHIDREVAIKSEKNIHKTTFNDNINTHSVLMDEIRNAGGLQKANLRSVIDRKTCDEMLPTGDGLMADLHKKLAMRRQGISGNNKQNDNGIEGVIYRMASTMLPPNPESESEADGDDDTEGDWDD